MNTMFVEYQLKSIEADQKDDGFYFELIPVSQSLRFFVKSKDSASIFKAFSDNSGENVSISIQSFDTGQQVRIGYGEWVWCKIV